MTNASEPQKLCFVIHPTSAEWRDYVEQVFEFIIAEAVESLGYTPIRADQVSDMGFISPQAIQHIAQDALVIADLTGQSPQVLYGLAVRHAAQKPVIHLIREGEAPIFEFSAIPALRVSVTSARDAKRCKQDLAAYVENLEKNQQPQETPVSRALRRQVLEQSESLLDRRASEMLRLLGSVKSALTDLSDRLAVPENVLPQEHVVNTLKNSGVLLSRDEIERAMGDVQGTMGSLVDRLENPENILPQEHLVNTLKNSGMLLSREELDRLMNDTFAYAEDAKGVLASIGSELSVISKALYAISTELGNHLNVPVDCTQMADRVEQNASGTMHVQNLIGDTLQKVDTTVSALGQLYRSLNRLTL
jgi:hypothetical protein